MNRIAIVMILFVVLVAGCAKDPNEVNITPAAVAATVVVHDTVTVTKTLVRPDFYEADIYPRTENEITSRFAGRGILCAESYGWSLMPAPDASGAGIALGTPTTKTIFTDLEDGKTLSAKEIKLLVGKEIFAIGTKKTVGKGEGSKITLLEVKILLVDSENDSWYN